MILLVRETYAGSVQMKIMDGIFMKVPYENECPHSRLFWNINDFFRLNLEYVPNFQKYF